MMPFSPPCELYAVTGRPVLHSRSPQLFQPVLDGYPAARYLRLAARNATEALTAAKHIGIKGLNVTAPFKEEMLRLADHADPAARNIGAANALTFDESGVTAWNTDHRGVAGALGAAGCDPAGKRAVVLGAGGAARAAAYGIIQAGGTVTIVNRTFDKGRSLAEQFCCQARPLEKLGELLADTDILVATIPDSTAVITRNHLHGGLTVLDADYRGTALARLCEKSGTRYVPGFEWLFYQALPAYRLFTGREPDTAIMRRGLAAPPLSAKCPVALIGFMGSGKTTAGRKLAELLGRELIDTDEAIERESGMAIAALFKDKGEPFFRERERGTLVSALNGPRRIVSCGGGMVLDDGNRRLLREKTTVVWLFTDAKTVLERIATDPARRPLLDVHDAERRASELIATRQSLYAGIADLVIDATALTADEMAALVAEELGRIA